MVATGSADLSSASSSSGWRLRDLDRSTDASKNLEALPLTAAGNLDVGASGAER